MKKASELKKLSYEELEKEEEETEEVVFHSKIHYLSVADSAVSR